MTLTTQLRLGIVAGVAAVSLIAMAGCSSKTSVSGKVTYDGKSVDDGGTITFKPTGQGKTVGGEIKDGKYYVDADRGLEAGSYKVEIYWNQKTGRQIVGNDPPNKVDETKQ